MDMEVLIEFIMNIVTIFILTYFYGLINMLSFVVFSLLVCSFLTIIGIDMRKYYNLKN